MRALIPVINESVTATIGSEVDFALTLADGTLYELLPLGGSCWIKQGTAQKITCVVKASLVDTDTITIAQLGKSSIVFEFDTAGNGVTFNSGRVQVNVSTDTTAAQVAARLRTAILAQLPALTVTDNGDGTLDVSIVGDRFSITEQVVNAGFTITTGTVLAASAATGSLPCQAGVSRIVDGKYGATVSIIQNGTDTGKASLTRLRYA
jgi:hypothetical protein